jgi:hypothetical protein
MIFARLTTPELTQPPCAVILATDIVCRQFLENGKIKQLTFPDLLLERLVLPWLCCGRPVRYLVLICLPSQPMFRLTPSSL